MLLGLCNHTLTFVVLICYYVFVILFLKLLSDYKYLVNQSLLEPYL